MPTHDPILDKNTDRTAKATAADKYQSDLIAQRQRYFGITIILLAVAVSALWYWNAPGWVLLSAPVIWLGYIVHNNVLLVLHELWELNDQIAGRKDEFQRVIREADENRNE